MTALAGAQQTITPAAPVQLQPPQSAYGSNTLVLDNLSGYLLQVNVGPDQFWHPPLVEDAYDVTTAPGVPVTVTAVALPGDTETSGTLAPTWYSELLSQMGKQYPIALSGPAEIAAAIIASGLPIVFTSTHIGRFTYTGAQINVDVHQYGSLQIVPSTLTFSGNLKYTWDATAFDFLTQPAPSIIPVLGPTWHLLAGGSQPWTFDLYGTNQRAPYPTHGDTAGYSAEGFRAQAVNINMVAGTTYNLSVVSGRPFQGPASLHMRANVTTVGGYLVANTTSGNGILLTDTNGLAAAAGGTSPSKTLQVALPQNLQQSNILPQASLSFIAAANGLQTIYVDLVPAY